MIVTFYLIILATLALAGSIIMSAWNRIAEVLPKDFVLLITGEIAQITVTFASLIAVVIVVLRERRLRDSKLTVPDNQTQQEWFDLPGVLDNDQALGTGAYLSRTGAKEYLASATYDEALLRAKNEDVLAFSWVPHALAQEHEIRNINCDARCVDTCKKPGCLCYRSIGKCK